MEFKCKVVAWYIENLESHKDTPNIPATSLQNLATKVGIDRRTVSRWVHNKEAIFKSKHKRQLKRLSNSKDECFATIPKK